MSKFVDITNIDRAMLLQEMWIAYIHPSDRWKKQPSYDECKQAIATLTSSNPIIEYFHGKYIKTNLFDDQVDSQSYNWNNYPRFYDHEGNPRLYSHNNWRETLGAIVQRIRLQKK